MQIPTDQSTPQPTIPVPVELQPGHPTRPITQREIQIMRSQRGEMSNQLQSAQDRRERLLNEIRTAPAGTEQGLLQQLQVLNDRIVRIERDIEASGATLRTGQVPVGITIVPPPDVSPQDVAERGAAVSVFVVVVVSVVYAVRRLVRRGRRVAQSYTGARDERMERLEQAVDAIAIEVERVGEAQRFQTKLLAEANIMPPLNVAQRAAEPVGAREYEEARRQGT